MNLEHGVSRMFNNGQETSLPTTFMAINKYSFKSIQLNIFQYNL